MAGAAVLCTEGQSVRALERHGAQSQGTWARGRAGNSPWAWCCAAGHPGAVCGSLPAGTGRSWGTEQDVSLAWRGTGRGVGGRGSQGHRVGEGSLQLSSHGRGARQGGSSQRGHLSERWSPGEALSREVQPRLGRWREGAVTRLGTRSLPRTTAVTNSLEYSMASSLQGKQRRCSGCGGRHVPTLLGLAPRVKILWGGHRCQAGLPAPATPFLGSSWHLTEPPSTDQAIPRPPLTRSRTALPSPEPQPHPTLSPSQV